MKRKILICLVIGLTLLAPMGIVKAGNATVVVPNAAPTINAYTIGRFSAVITALEPNQVFWANVSVTDTDGIADIWNTTIDLRLSTYNISNDPARTYKFAYNESKGTVYQIWPTSGSYIISCVRSIWGTTHVNYSIEFILNKTAADTNGLATWHYSIAVKDKSDIISTSAQKDYSMGAFVEISYFGNAGGTDFTWTGVAESNISAAFNTVVTSNDVYELNASYTGFFVGGGGQSWGNPSVNPKFWVKRNIQLAYTLLNNATLSHTNTTWFTNTALVYGENFGHTLNLEFPPGLTKGVTYSGVTIWIQAKNN